MTTQKILGLDSIESIKEYIDANCGNPEELIATAVAEANKYTDTEISNKLIVLDENNDINGYTVKSSNNEWKLNNDGSGQLADSHIVWREDGSGYIGNKTQDELTGDNFDDTIQWDQDGNIKFGDNIRPWNNDINELKESKQSTLVSGVNIKTINNQSILGRGNIVIKGGGIADLSEYVTETELNEKGFVTKNDLNDKQDILESGVNIKTINNQSILGSGNIVIKGGGIADLSGYATKSELNDKQDKLISGINIKKINGYSLLGDGEITISGSGETVDLSNYATKNELDNVAADIEEAVNKVNKALIVKPDGHLSRSLQYITSTETGLVYSIGNWTESSDEDDILISDSYAKVNFANKNEVKSKYTKPVNGIPIEDLSVELQSAINNAATKAEVESKYTKPIGGIKAGDLDPTINAALLKANNAITEEVYKGTVTGVKVNGNVINPFNGIVEIGNLATKAEVDSKYTKPVSGIKAADLDPTINAALLKANNAVSKNDITELQNDVQTALEKANNAITEEVYKGTVTGVKVNGNVINPVDGIVELNALATKAEVDSKYTFPGDGIPREHLSRSVRMDLEKRGTVEGISVNGLPLVPINGIISLGNLVKLEENNGIKIKYITSEGNGIKYSIGGPIDDLDEQDFLVGERYLKANYVKLTDLDNYLLKSELPTETTKISIFDIFPTFNVTLLNGNTALDKNKYLLGYNSIKLVNSDCTTVQFDFSVKDTVVSTEKIEEPTCSIPAWKVSYTNFNKQLIINPNTTLGFTRVEPGIGKIIMPLEITMTDNITTIYNVEFDLIITQ